MSASSPAHDNNEGITANVTPASKPGVPLQALRQFTQEREAVRVARVSKERCELCSEPIPSQHRHLLDLSKREVICACNACTLLFGNEGAGAGKYRIIHSRCLIMPNFQMTDEQWDELTIPVNMVYMFRSTTFGGQQNTTHTTPAQHVMAFYPSPAGAIESLLQLESWEVLVHNNPILNDLKPDVEALLINRIRDKRIYYIVPIDICYQLVGLIRTHWKGLSGGEEVWKAIGEFFTALQAKAQIVEGETNA